jgi:hypothetical protein
MQKGADSQWSDPHTDLEHILEECSLVASAFCFSRVGDENLYAAVLPARAHTDLDVAMVWARARPLLAAKRFARTRDIRLLIIAPHTDLSALITPNGKKRHEAIAALFAPAVASFVRPVAAAEASDDAAEVALHPALAGLCLRTAAPAALPVLELGLDSLTALHAVAVLRDAHRVHVNLPQLFALTVGQLNDLFGAADSAAPAAAAGAAASESAQAPRALVTSRMVAMDWDAEMAAMTALLHSVPRAALTAALPPYRHVLLTGLK